MMSKLECLEKKDHLFLFLLSAALAALILVIDLSLPLGVAGGVPYVALIMVSLWFPRRRFTIIAAGIGSILTIIGFFFSPSGGVLWVVLLNRFLAIFAIWVTAVITFQRKRAEEEIKTLARFPAENPNPVLRVSGEGVVQYTNNAGRQLCSPESSEKAALILPREMKRAIAQVNKHGNSMQMDYRDGKRVFSVLFSAVQDADYINVYGTDITERKKMEKMLHRLSTSDGLTGLANRRCFDDALRSEWRRARRFGIPLSLLMIDLDFFKDFNDAYGHPAGDETLKRVASVLASELHRPGDLGARYGGEEFVLLLPGTGSKGALALAESIKEKVEELHIAHTRSHISEWVTLSLGVATTFPDENGEPERLVADADRYLYRAKEEGRNRVKTV